MAGAGAPRVIPFEASDATGGELAIPKSTGKGLSWTEDENIALARAASVVCTDPIVIGSGQTAAMMNRKIRAAFINDQSKPPDACTTRDKGPLDSRKWDGRSFVACGKQWEVLRRECTKFKGCVDRIHKMKLTGNPTEEDIYRCACLLYSDGSQSASHVYDCVRNPAYHISKPFKFKETYLFLSTRTTLLEAGGVVSTDEQKRTERTMGTKAAKKLKESKKTTVAADGNTSMSASIKRIEELLATNAAKRRELTQQKLSFQKERMEWEMAKTLLGPGSNASTEERNTIGGLLRKRLVTSLSQDMVENSEKKVCLPSEHESSGVSALLKMSNVSVCQSENVRSSISNVEDTGGDSASS